MPGPYAGMRHDIPAEKGHLGTFLLVLSQLRSSVCMAPPRVPRSWSATHAGDLRKARLGSVPVQLLRGSWKKRKKTFSVYEPSALKSDTRE